VFGSELSGNCENLNHGRRPSRPLGAPDRARATLGWRLTHVTDGDDRAKNRVSAGEGD
jgi:hypothetical protein